MLSWCSDLIIIIKTNNPLVQRGFFQCGHSRGSGTWALRPQTQENSLFLCVVYRPIFSFQLLLATWCVTNNIRFISLLAEISWNKNFGEYFGQFRFLSRYFFALYMSQFNNNRHRSGNNVLIFQVHGVRGQGHSATPMKFCELAERIWSRTYTDTYYRRETNWTD